jgi:hypothetical protein
LVLVYMYTNAIELGHGTVCLCALERFVDPKARDCTNCRICVGPRSTEDSSCSGISVNNTTG